MIEFLDLNLCHVTKWNSKPYIANTIKKKNSNPKRSAVKTEMMCTGIDKQLFAKRLKQEKKKSRSQVSTLEHFQRKQHT